MIKLTLEMDDTPHECEIARKALDHLMTFNPITIDGGYRVESITKDVRGKTVITMCDEASYER